MSNPLYFQDTNITTLVEHLQQIPRSEHETVLLLVAEHSKMDIQALSAACKQHQIPVVGGVFPGVIYADHRYETGVVVDVLPLMAKPSLITGLNSDDFLLHGVPELPAGEQYTALVLVDGLTKYISAFLDVLFRYVGEQVNYIGGGAGSLSFEQKPCLFDNQGVYQDAAVVLWLKTTADLGVRHGWQKLQGPFIASEAEGTIVRQLSRKSAFQVYNEIIQKKTRHVLTSENFFAIAKQFPLGIYNPHMDYIVRDPITFTQEGALVCVGEVPRGAMLYILQGDKQSLIDNARLATTEAVKKGTHAHHNLIVDCISRVLYLEDEFEHELQAVLNALPEGAPTPFGMLSLGEIATFTNGRVEFFNKTIVVGSLHNLTL